VAAEAAGAAGAAAFADGQQIHKQR